MSIRTTITLDEDVLERVKQESRSRGASFKTTLNDLLRVALAEKPKARRKPFKIRPTSMGYYPELNYDKVEALIEYGEGPFHR
jgi:hypothetical protein